MRWLFVLGCVPVMAMAQDFDKLVDRYFDECHFAFSPSSATAAGVHTFDGKLEDYSRAGVDRAAGVLKRFEREFSAVAPAKLNAVAKTDREIVLSQIHAELLELEVLRGWERDPDRYSSGVTNAVFVIMSRKFAPAAERLRSVIARERQMPAVFDAARSNLKNPPRIYTEIAIEQMPGIISFFKNDVPAAFSEVKDAALLAEFHESNRAVIAALEAYGQFLKNDLLPRSKGDFRIGAENYRKKLLYEEMIETPLDALLQAGYADLHKNQEAFRRLAAQVNPKLSPQATLKQLEQDYPAPDQLLETFRQTLGGIREFIEKKQIVTIPSQVLPILEETPPFMRALTFASMDTPGPFEKVAKEAFFNVTLPEKSWSADQVREHMTAFNRGVIMTTAIHEAYPGHYVQFLWVQSAPSKVRKLLGCSSNAEGWAHYTEQMMLDEGFGGNDPKLRLGQLQDALLRNARYIAGIEMHTGKMTFEQAVEFFQREGFQSSSTALREVKRGTSDPTYLVYTLGKLEILKLREEYRRKRGAEFSLREFHDRFLAQGFPPIRIVRQSLGL